MLVLLLLVLSLSENDRESRNLSEANPSFHFLMLSIIFL